MAGINVAFGKTDKPRNSTKVPPVGNAYLCLLKDTTSALHPTIELKYEGFPDWNYCYIAEFNRYYYITDMRSFPAYMWEIDCAVDVLATYSNEIKATRAYVMYAENLNDPMIPDSRLPMTDNFVASTVVDMDFPEYDSGGVYILSMVSKGGSTGGFCAVYAMTSNELSDLRDRLLDPSILDEFKDYFLGQPANAVVGCIWLPIKASALKAASFPVTAFCNELGISASSSGMELNGTVMVNIPLYWVDEITGSWQTYLNFEPYSSYAISLPGVGLITLPMSSIASTTAGGTSVQIQCKYGLSSVDGKITWTILNANSVKVLSAEGYIGVVMPVGGSSINPVGYVAGGVSAIMGAITVNPMMLAGGLTMCSKAVQQNHQITGSLGGRSPKDILSKITVVRQSNMPAATPGSVRQTIGMPYFKQATIGSIQGRCICTGASVKCSATEEEHEQINGYVNNEQRVAYGGIIVE